jgi:Kyanoviridae DNA polymerase
VDNAEAVTITGQFIIQQLGNKLNEYLNRIFKTEQYEYVVYQDTDSCYLCLDKLVESKGLTDDDAITDLLEKASSKNIEPLIAKILDDIVVKYLNGMPGALSMKREVIAKKAIWTAKKRYILWVLDTEGIRHNPPKLKAMGVEIKKAVIPKFCKERMTEAIKIIMQTDVNQTVIDFITKVKVEFNSKTPNEISMPKTCNGLEKYSNPKAVYIKGTPLHVRGALMYNHLLVKHGLEMKYESIKSGDKIRFLNLRIPNPTRENVIAFPSQLPKEFGLDQYIDYELQLSKSFLEPLEIILKAIKWTSEKRSSLKKFF